MFERLLKILIIHFKIISYVDVSGFFLNFINQVLRAGQLGNVLQRIYVTLIDHSAGSLLLPAVSTK